MYFAAVLLLLSHTVEGYFFELIAGGCWGTEVGCGVQYGEREVLHTVVETLFHEVSKLVN